MEITTGKFIKVEKDGAFFEGNVIKETDDEITMKIDGGYIVGFNKENIKVVEVEKTKEEVKIEEEKKEVKDEKKEENEKKEKVKEEKKGEEEKKEKREWEKKNVSILAVGGTIACTYDEKTYTASPAVTADEMLADIPELKNYANINTRQVDNILSENMKPKHWINLAKIIYEEIKSGADGIIVTCGTDTLSYVASAISFMVKTSVPIVFTGSQKNADRPGSDNHMNLICSVKVATSDIAESVVVMHGTVSDDYCEIHRATKVRKMHSSRRDAFKSINAKPIGEVEYKKDEIRILSDYVKRGEIELKLKPDFVEKCALIKFFPGSDPKIIDFYVDEGYYGLVIEGVGMGHVSDDWISHLKRACDKNVLVVITTQTIYGKTNQVVYETGRKLSEAGVVGVEDMTSETALVKLMWVLGNCGNLRCAKHTMKKNLRGEIEKRHLIV
ncbi:MAG: Glu-tRNA(Gln) amidotransferase subunit GatD [Methanosarcinaceae archaeon]|nr:Glu-tRNA(Gln) amidotransferase subunit GatD [Methanosarcinaceae archaeon]